MKAIVIGAGLFGSVIAAELRRWDVKVTVIDDQRPLSGSKPAACLMKPSWFQSGMTKQQSKDALELLDRHYGVNNLRFRVSLATATVHYCNPQLILKGADVTDRVTAVFHNVNGRLSCMLNSGKTLDAPFVVVAAGVWAAELANVDDGVSGLTGAAHLWPKEEIAEPFIKPYAPYKQYVAFNRGDGLWVGDGTAIKSENWTDQRARLSYERCATAAGLQNKRSPHTTMVGIRPYTPKHKPCYLKEEHPGLWVVTGGAKNGLIAAGWAASEIAKKVFK